MDKAAHRYFGIYKPVNMVSQFISPDKVGLLGDIDFEYHLHHLCGDDCCHLYCCYCCCLLDRSRLDHFYLINNFKLI